MSAISSSTHERVLALHSFTAENDDELSFAAGEYVEVLEKDEVYGDGWWKGRSPTTNLTGLFPASYILPEGVDPAPYLAMQTGGGGVLPSPPFGSMGQVAERGTFGMVGEEGKEVEPTQSNTNGNGNGETGHPLTATESTTSLASTATVPAGNHPQDAPDVRSRLAESARVENARKEGEGSNGNSNGTGNGGVGGLAGLLGRSPNPNGLLSSSNYKSASSSNPSTGVRMSAGAGMASGLVYSDESGSDGEDDVDSDDEGNRRELEKRLSAGDGGRGSPKAKSRNLGGVGGRLGDDKGFDGWSGAAAGAFGVKSPVVVTPPASEPSKNLGAGTNHDEKSSEITPSTSPRLMELPASPLASGSSNAGLGGELPPFPSSTTALNERSETSTPQPIPTKAFLGTSGTNTPHAFSSADNTPLGPPPLPTPTPLKSPATNGLQPSFMGMDESPSGGTYLGGVETNGTFANEKTSAAAVPEYDPMAAKGAELATERDMSRVENVTAKEAPAATSAPIVTPTPTIAPTPAPHPILAPIAVIQRQASSDVLNARPTSESGSKGSGGNTQTRWSGIAGDARLWTVEQVVEWAKSRGFDQTICDKFSENEIDGDVLLDLDANLLKELDIPQFGKRIKIANAINELRRPASNLSAGVGGQAVYTRPGSAMGGSSSPSPLPGSGYPASPTYSGYPESQPSHSRAASMSGYNNPDVQGLGFSQESRKPSEVSTGNYSEWAHGKIQNQHQGRKASGQDSFKAIREEDENVKGNALVNPLITPEAPSTGAMPAFPVPVTTPHTATTTASSIRSRNSSIPPSPSTPNTQPSSLERGGSFGMGHRKDKSNGDRSSFFGGGLNRTRKPAPRFPSSASSVAVDRTADVGASPTGKSSGMRFGRNNRTSGTPSVTTAMVSAPTSPARPVARNATGSTAGGAVATIGTPDFSGYMKKKGENYRSWKVRYFVLKGAHLYYMRNETEEKIKGHIDLHGYKVLADSGNPGSYGFQIVHDRGAPHSFSSGDQKVIKEWMKQLMKATITRDYSAPVVSSCNIPTIPLKEAQALQPRPPSPGARDATQRATRRDNPNQLTARDASVLMSLDNNNTPSSPGMQSGHAKSPSLGRQSQDRSYMRNSISGASLGVGQLPPRPSREMRMASNASSVYPDEPTGAPTPRSNPSALFGHKSNQSTPNAIAQNTFPAAAPPPTTAPPTVPNPADPALLAWVNEHLPRHETRRATSIPQSFISGLLVTRVIEYFTVPPFPPPSNPSSSIPANAEQFEEIGGEANLEGLFTMMDKAIDEGMDTAGVSINDVRTGKEVEVRRLIESLRVWGEEKEREAGV